MVTKESLKSLLIYAIGLAITAMEHTDQVSSNDVHSRNGRSWPDSASCREISTDGDASHDYY